MSDEAPPGFRFSVGRVLTDGTEEQIEGELTGGGFGAEVLDDVVKRVLDAWGEAFPVQVKRTPARKRPK